MKLKDIFNMKRLRGTGIGAAVGTVAAVAALVFIPGAALLLPVVPTLIVGAGLSDHRFGGDQQAGDRGGVLQRRAHDLGRVDDAHLTMSPYSSVCALKPKVVVLVRASCRQRPSLRRRRSRRSGGSELRAPCGRCRCRLLVVVVALQPSARAPWLGAQQGAAAGTMPSSTAARVAFSASSTRSLRSFTSTSVAPPTRSPQRRRRAWPDAPAASRGRSPRWSLRSAPDLRNAGFDVGLLAGAVDDRGVLLVDRTRLARPSMSSVTFSSLMPRSSEITWPPVRIAMSSSMALRRSPKPGALTAATFRPPRSLLTTSVARASPSTSSAMISSGGRLHDGFEHRQHRLQEESFFSWRGCRDLRARRSSCRRW
jgi:hypothetical protein